MNKIDESRLAFPMPAQYENCIAVGKLDLAVNFMGMSLRQWFAGQALGVAARMRPIDLKDWHMRHSIVAAEALAYADALIAAIKKEPT